MSQFAILPLRLAAIFRWVSLAAASSGAPAFGTAETGDRDGIGAPASGTAVPGGRNEGGIGIVA